MYRTESELEQRRPELTISEAEMISVEIPGRLIKKIIWAEF